MWVSASSTVRPSTIDKTIDPDFVYVRKDIEEIEVTYDDNTQTEYTYLEEKVPKSSWETYEKIMGHSEELSDIEAAIVELADLIVGGE